MKADWEAERLLFQSYILVLINIFSRNMGNRILFSDVSNHCVERSLIFWGMKWPEVKESWNIPKRKYLLMCLKAEMSKKYVGEEIERNENVEEGRSVKRKWLNEMWEEEKINDVKAWKCENNRKYWREGISGYCYEALPARSTEEAGVKKLKHNKGRKQHRKLQKALYSSLLRSLHRQPSASIAAMRTAEIRLRPHAAIFSSWS